jgi:hypothetical protein
MQKISMLHVLMAKKVFSFVKTNQKIHQTSQSLQSNASKTVKQTEKEPLLKINSKSNTIKRFWTNLTTE